MRRARIKKIQREQCLSALYKEFDKIKSDEHEMKKLDWHPNAVSQLSL